MIILHLRIRVQPSRRAELIAFLGEAISYYEEPGGIRVRLFERQEVPGELIEVVEYDSIERYQRDQERVEHDPRMIALLERWRGILEEPPVIERYEEIEGLVAH